jgi:fructose-1,6-bisphosphatase II / sedoheptulose-1,7-bisphosphatase
VRRTPGFITTHSVVMRSTSGTVRWISARHPRRRNGGR